MHVDDCSDDVMLICLVITPGDPLSGRELLDFSREGQSVLKPPVSSRPKRDAIQAPQGPSVTRGGKDTRFAMPLQALLGVAQTPDRPASLAASTVRDSGPPGAERYGRRTKREAVKGSPSPRGEYSNYGR